MDDSRQRVLPKLIRACSTLLIVAGAIVFWAGGKFLHSSQHTDILTSEVYGVFGGLLLVAVGSGIGLLGKSSSPAPRVADEARVEAKAVDLRIRSRVNARREFVASGNGALFDRMQEIFYKSDPLQLGDSSSAKDEYGSPVSTIIPRLSNCSGIEEARFVIEQELNRHYPDYDFDSSRIENIADNCWNEWTRSQLT